MIQLRTLALIISGLFAFPAEVCAQIEPSDAGSIRAGLDSLVARKEYAAAEAMLQEYIKRGADSAGATFQMGRVYFEHDIWLKSVAFLETALRLNPDNAEAHRLLGLDYRALHRPDDAEAQLIDSARIDPSSRINAYLAGHQLLLNGKAEAALPYLYNALNSKPLESQALLALALAQARLGNYGLAESYYRNVIDLPQGSTSEQYSALVNLSVLLLLGHSSEGLDEGLRCAQRAAKLQPDSVEAHFLAGKALFKLGRYREAASELTRAASLNPQDSKPHFLLAQVYEHLGEQHLADKERKSIARIARRPGQTGIAADGPFQ